MPAVAGRTAVTAASAQKGIRIQIYIVQKNVTGERDAEIEHAAVEDRHHGMGFPCGLRDDRQG